MCDWYGIICDPFHPDIAIGIDLSGFNIAGQILPSLGLLTSLMHINLSEVRLLLFPFSCLDLLFF